MNRLSLCQRLIQEAGISGSMTTTINQTGEMLRVVSWIDTAWEELQTKHDDWSWMKSSVLLGAGASFTTVAGTAYYPLGTGAGTSGITAANFGKWDMDSFRCFLTSTGYVNEIFLDKLSFAAWRDAYMYGTMRNVQTRPVAVASGPNMEVCIGPAPAAGYTINGDYFTAPTVMAADIDTPTGLPTRFHMAIMWNALMMYAGYEAASEVYQRGENGYNRLVSELEANYAPRTDWVGALC